MNLRSKFLVLNIIFYQFGFATASISKETKVSFPALSFPVKKLKTKSPGVLGVKLNTFSLGGSSTGWQSVPIFPAINPIVLSLSREATSNRRKPWQDVGLSKKT